MQIGFVVFLMAYIYFALGRTPDTPSGVEWYILSYMIGFSMEKIREVVGVSLFFNTAT